MRKLVLMSILLIACGDPMGPPGVDVFTGRVDVSPHLVVADIDPYRPITCVIDGQEREWYSGPFEAPPAPYCGRFYREEFDGTLWHPKYDITIENTEAGARYRVTLGVRPVADEE